MAHPSLRVVSGLPLVRERLARLYAERRAGNGAAFAAAFAEDGERVFATPGAERGLRWRAPGAIATATMSTIDDRLDPTLISRFFAP